jgi:hypothetical protein
MFIAVACLKTVSFVPFRVYDFSSAISMAQCANTAFIHIQKPVGHIWKSRFNCQPVVLGISVLVHVQEPG